MKTSHPMRQRMRRLAAILSLLALPVTLNYFSPYLSTFGAWQGILAGSVLVFAGLALSALFLGRAFCGWLCPLGALQDWARGVNDRPARGLRAAKWFLFVPWFGFLLAGFLRAGGIRVVDPFFMTEGGVSVTEAGNLVIYFGVLALALGLALIGGRRAFCHGLCWLAPFMLAGRRLSRLLRLPSLRLAARGGECGACGRCGAACPMSLPVDALVRSGDPDDPGCALCGECADACPRKILHFTFGVKR